MADIFLSYSSKDKDRVRPLVHALECEGWTVWWDRKVPAGDSFAKMIDRELKNSKCVVVVWSHTSIDSEWVQAEAEHAKKKNLLFPATIDRVEIPLAFALRQAVNLVGWNGYSTNQEFQHLVQSIREKIGRGQNAPESGKWERPPIPDNWQIGKILPIIGTILLVSIVIFGIYRFSGEDKSQKSQTQSTPDAADGNINRTSLNQGVPPIPQSTPNAVDAKVNIQMVNLPGGEFQMGSTFENDEQPLHWVKVAPFSIGKYEVTQAEWKAVMGNNPSFFESDKNPVYNVSWEDVQEFLKKIGNGYRLPTEAEWEYAARAGTTTKWSFGDDEGKLGEYAWYGGLFSGTHPVGEKKPNGFGLYDMHGNVWEWVEDPWHDNYKGAPTDGSAWLTGGNTSYRVLRGGSWNYTFVSTRSANRIYYHPDNRYFNFGFRVVVGAQTQRQK